MEYLKKTLLGFILFIFYFTSKADVIYSPTHKGTALSLEGIASYELAFTSWNTINIWGGGGIVFPLDNFQHPAFGSEIALEIRQYFSRDSFRKFNFGLYAGLACMIVPEVYNGRIVNRKPSVGFVPGIKMTYKQPVAEKLVAEPYISFSIPFYDESFRNIFHENVNAEFMITIGLRIGFNQVKKL